MADLPNDILISLDNISKCYRRYAHPSLRLVEMFWPGKIKSEEFWALRGVSLTLHRGETLGVMGRNGSGKSTLLQIIAGTLAATQGKVQVNGRVAALLELGSGFNPEFTGRENVYFNGQVMGLTALEIDQRLDDIIEFAEVGTFIDQPLRSYSSGMMVRLAFSVATTVEPDILIVDEALAVGDLYFQAKCFKRMRQMMDRGVTILFVSHDISSMTALCSRCIWLDRGQLILDGSPADVTQAYQQQAWVDQGLLPAEAAFKPVICVPGEQANDPKNGQGPGIPEPEGEHVGNGAITIKGFQLCDQQGYPRKEVNYNEPLQAVYLIQARAEIPVYDIGFIVKDVRGNEIFSMIDFQSEDYPPLKAGQVAEVKVPVILSLRSGAYFISVGVIGYQNHQRYCQQAYNLSEAIIYDYVEQGYGFTVNLNGHRPIHGPYHVEAKFQVHILNGATSPHGQTSQVIR